MVHRAWPDRSWIASSTSPVPLPPEGSICLLAQRLVRDLGVHPSMAAQALADSGGLYHPARRVLHAKLRSEEVRPNTTYIDARHPHRGRHGREMLEDIRQMLNIPCA